MGIQFTDEQLAVIEAKNCNLLVSAAAGSGKTAVLVERIIRMISSDLDVDRLLVVTFTRAAASQMKEKITDAIQKKLAEDPKNVHLQKQETLIHSAQITTIDSFCQYVIRNNFNAIGLDPAFRVADEGELRLLQEDVLSDMMEEEYARAGEEEVSDFLFCMEYFATGSRDTKVEGYIRQLFDFSMSMPWPEDWIKERARDYLIEEEDFDSLPWVKECLERSRLVLEECASKLDMALAIASDPDGPYMYEDNLEAEKSAVYAALHYDSYDAAFSGIRGIAFGRLPSKKDDSVSTLKRENVKRIRDMVKKDIGDLSEKYFALTRETIIEQMKLCDRAIKELCRLTLEFKRRYEEKKRLQQIIDFSDMEHFALDILVRHPDEEACRGRSVQEIMQMSTPTDVALEYRDYYREVLIDEYQDSNYVQELILKAIAGETAGKSKRFMVGDVKQSIYKFRLARPGIFMEKFHSYSREASAGDRRIDLHSNFRSRAGVLDITNYIFRKIMAQDLGGVSYDKDAELVPGAKYDEPSFDVTSELLVVDGKDVLEEPDDAVSSLSLREKEALLIAERIHGLRRENPDLKYSDIVILLRSLSGWDDVFKDVLVREGIPTYTESKKGYFDAPEIAVLLNALNIIDNPRQDIPLVSVMRSQIGGFSDEELALLRIAVDEASGDETADSFYDGLLMDIRPEEALLTKVKEFIARLEEYRVMSTYTPVHELLQHIVDRTDFEVMVSAMPGGEQRRANVELLIDNAANFEKTSFKGLFHFIRYIEHIRYVQVDYGEAGTVDENADVVRIMSIHKSKGLEFPVVFVAGLSKEFNTRDTTGDLIVDMDFGVGVKCINSELRVKYDTLKRQLIADSMKLDSLGEEIRVLYVALTRAREKLIMTAGVKDMQAAMEKQMIGLMEPGGSGPLPYSVRSGAASFFLLILPSLMHHPSMREVLTKYGLDTDLFDKCADEKSLVPELKIQILGEADLRNNMVEEQVGLIVRRDELKAAIPGADVDEELLKELKERFSAGYAHESLKGLFTKTTVSELKKAHMIEEGEVFGNSAGFVKEAEVEAEVEGTVSGSAVRTGADEKEVSGSAVGVAGADEKDAAIDSERMVSVPRRGRTGLSGAERGTAYHRIMELLDESIYGDEALMDEAKRPGGQSTGSAEKAESRVPDRVSAFMKNMAAKGMIPPEYPGNVRANDIASFLGSDLGQRMGRAFRRGELMREKPFMMGVSARELSEKFPEEEMVLIQGIIDAWFIEDGEIVLLDYKTDRVDTEKELTDRYQVQLDLYRRALEAAVGMKVKEVYIYSFRLNKAIAL